MNELSSLEDFHLKPSPDSGLGLSKCADFARIGCLRGSICQGLARITQCQKLTMLICAQIDDRGTNPSTFENIRGSTWCAGGVFLSPSLSLSLSFSLACSLVCSLSLSPFLSCSLSLSLSLCSVLSLSISLPLSLLLPLSVSFSLQENVPGELLCLSDYSKVDMRGPWYTPVNFEGERGTWCTGEMPQC